MKTLFHLLLLAGLSLSFALPAQAQCGYYHNLKPGNRFEMTTYDRRDRLTGRITQEVGKVEEKGGTTTAQMHQKVYDEKGKLITESDYSVECRAGLVRIDMRSLFSPQAGPSLGTGATAQVTGDLLELPTELKPGTSLKNASMTATVSSQSGLPASNTVVTVTNRKVEALEPQTTPAGTFKCVKISQDMEVRMGIGPLSIPMSMHTVEWYAPGVGAVRTETYRKDKLMSYTLLTTKP